MKTYWNALYAGGPICDETVNSVIAAHERNGVPLTKNLVNDDEQYPDGGAWQHILGMAERGLVVITNGEVKRSASSPRS